MRLKRREIDLVIVVKMFLTGFDGSATSSSGSSAWASHLPVAGADRIYRIYEPN